MFRCSDFRISIHAPTRGATALCCCQGLVPNISIHAPTRGATYVGRAVRTMYEISIHAPTRGATIISNAMDDGLNISIHAPTRGATHSTSQDNLSKHFNPRSHERSDSRRRALGCQLFVFQSTLPREERRNESR